MMSDDMKLDVFEETIIRIGTQRASDALDGLALRLAARGIVVETFLELEDTGEIVLNVGRLGNPTVWIEERIAVSASTVEFSRIVDEIDEQLVRGIRAKKRARVAARRAAKG